MNAEAILAALTAAGDAMKALLDRIAVLEKRTADLQAKVLAHDQSLQTATPPGPQKEG